MPQPPEIALRSLLNEINLKRDALAAQSEKACKLMAGDELQDIVSHCVGTDAVLCVAEAIALASLNAGQAVQS